MGNMKLGAIELKPKRKFYDYEAKYNSKAKTKHIIPVDLSKKKFNKVLLFILFPTTSGNLIIKNLLSCSKLCAKISSKKWKLCMQIF